MNVEQAYIKKVDTLVPCPQIALEVLELAHGVNCDFNQLTRKIESDPSLTANMLRMANSAYFGHMRKISSVKDIIVRLGLECVKLIAITSASVGLLKNPQEAYNLEAGALWQHCHATATLASIIGRHAKMEESYPIYTAALLHDVGKVILNRPLQRSIIEHKESVENKSLLEIEHLHLNTDHAKVGMVLLESWGLPADITVPVGFHHDYNNADAAHREVTRIVHLANALMDGMGFSAADAAGRTIVVDDYVDSEVYAAIPHFQEDMEAIIEEFYQKMHDSSQL